MNKTAIVIGATGLVGTQLVQQLINHNNYGVIKIFTRRSIENKNSKIKEYIVDFDDINSFKHEITGDTLFSTMGTTIKTAGSKEAQYKVDYNYQYEFARIAADNGIKNYVLVSSAGADDQSKFFYMRMKGELELAVKALPFQSVSIIRPATLVGERPEKRAGEKVAIKVTSAMAGIIPGLKKYRPIKGSIVATAMINALQRDDLKKFQIYSFEEVFELAQL